ncbi:TPA: hypothetical protein OQV31_004364 [Shigella flexneri]|nr:hypothetical protein [Shigella flexneri]
MIGVKQPLPKAVLRTQHDKNKEAISILDFGVIDDGVTDNYQAIQNAIDAVASLPSGGELFIPASNQAVGYIVGSTLLIPGVLTSEELVRHRNSEQKADLQDLC